MFKIFGVLLLALSCLAAPLQAQERVTLGQGRLFDNDAIGDGEDRWRSGSYTVSWLRGTDWRGKLPGTFGEILEYRLRSEITAPADLVSPEAGDRRYVGAISLGLHTHFALGQAEARVGADLVLTGKQTGIGRFQREVHDLLGMETPGVLNDQIPNGVHPTLSGEIGRSFTMGRARLHPFIEAQAGVESLMRVGGDLVIGSFGQDSLMLRDTTTGQRYHGIEGYPTPGVSFTLGGDVARVFDSAFLPDGDPAVLAQSRARLRAGVNWTGEKSQVFYGLTWLGKEFETQTEEQVVGSLRLRVRF